MRVISILILLVQVPVIQAGATVSQRRVGYVGELGLWVVPLALRAHMAPVAIRGESVALCIIVFAYGGGSLTFWARGSVLLLGRYEASGQSTELCLIDWHSLHQAGP